MTQQNYSNLSYLPANENAMPYEPNAMANTLVEETKKHRALYPEVHYKLKPFISATCDAIHSSGMMPTQEEFDNITDNIYDEFCKMHPDMSNYMKSDDKDDPQEAVPAIGYGGYGRGFGFNGFRRRGLGRDLIGGLLLAELFGRGYPYNYYPYSYNPYYY